uniref:Cell division protein n=1 Tax=Kirchneriella aperta TaxID=117505 RepID=A0A140H9W4_9CHLO|nr:cell division protein [Kirchneriella aperta]AMO00963.1 cell division protein [Kirchneriella aperta]
MNLKFTKKFLKKNMLLQQDLEKFLTWRDTKKINTYPIKFLKKPPTLFQKNFFGSQQTSRRLYRPINSKRSDSILKQRVLFSNFFPHKKPFMHFWILPLLGGCFLSLITLKNNTFSINKFKHFSNQPLPIYNFQNSQLHTKWKEKETSSNKILKTLLVNSTKTESHFNKSFLQKSLQNSVDFDWDRVGSNRNLLFSGNYAKNTQKFSKRPGPTLSKNILPSEFENLCVFYLNLTNQNLTSCFDTRSFKNTSELLSEHTIQKNSTFKQPIALNWTWYTLQESTRNSAFLRNCPSDYSKYIDSSIYSVQTDKFLQYFNVEAGSFPQKMENNSVVFENDPAHFFPVFIPDFNNQSSHLPHISYLQAANLFDRWIKKLELSSSTHFVQIERQNTKNPNLFLKFLRNDFQSSQKMSLFDLLKKVYLIEHFLLNASSKQEKSLPFYFSNLLTIITENQKNLTDEAILLQNWKKLYPEMLSLLYSYNNRLNSLDKKISQLKKQNIIENFNSFEQGKVHESILLLNKLVSEINLYRQLKTVSQRLREFPILTDKNDLFNTTLNRERKIAQNESLANKIIKYKTPILQSDILTSYILSCQNEHNLLLTDRNKELFKTDLKLNLKYLNQTSLSLIDLAQKQTNLASSLISYQKPSFFTLNSGAAATRFLTQRNNISLIQEKKENNKLNFIQFFFDNIQKQEGPIASSQFLESGVPFDLANNKSNFRQTKNFVIMKKFSNLKNQKVFLLKPFQSLNSKEVKNDFKPFKFKRTLNSKPSYSVFEKRKAEKIFRTYLSVKSIDNPEKSESNNLLTSKVSETESNQKFFLRVLPILRELKNIIKTQKVSLKREKTWISVNLFENFSAKNQAFLLKQNSLSNFQQKPFILSNFPNSWKSSKKKIFQDFQKAGSSHKFNNLDLETFLKRFGGPLNFFKKSNFSMTDIEKKRLEKRKTVQKKRRLKKLKLENRRRKKRKRFYPRPNYLRFQLYYSFLQKRHPQNFQKHFSKNILDSKDGFSSIAEVTGKENTHYSLVDQNKTFFLNQKIQPLLSETPPLFERPFVHKNYESLLFKEKIYRKNKQNWGNISYNSFSLEKHSLKKRPLGFTKSTYHQQEFFKVSNETLTEFERLCWKSYWLRSNLTPYIRRIQTNLKRMQKIESAQKSETTFLNILNDLFPWSIKQSSTRNRKLKTVNVRKQLRNLTPAYLNIQQSLENSFFKISSSTLFKRLENKAEYDRFIYERITDEIKNVKSQLNVDGQNHARSYKPGRQKIEKKSSKDFLSSFNNFKSSFTEPKIQPFSLFSPLNDSSLKPFGDLPTLRLLWACNKTNLFTYNENNFARTLWSTYKNREQTKNNKTKKFISKMFQTYSLIPKNLSSISSTKTQLACKKIQLFGGFIYGKNYNSYLRRLKYNLQMSHIAKLQLLKKEKNLVNSKETFEAKKFLFSNSLEKKNPDFKFEKKMWFENSSIQKPQKRMIHFWWSTKQINPIEQIFSFWLLSPQTFPSLDFYINENTNSIIEKDEILNNQSFITPKTTSPISLLQNSNFRQININKSLILTSFWICCILFHISILFTILRIPEIRSLAKFQFLILSKLTNTYLICLFSIYDLLKDYQSKINSLMKKSLKFSLKDSSSSSLLYKKVLNLRSKSPEVYWSEKTKFKRIYKQDLFNNELFKTVKSEENVNKQNPSFDKFMTNEIKIQRNFVEQISEQKTKPLIQSTLSFELNFREFLNLSRKNQMETSNLKLGINKFKNLQFIISHSLNPSFGKTPISDQSKVFQNSVKKNWFYSWYTGFLWSTFYKFLENSTFSEKKKAYLKQNLTKLMKPLDIKKNLYQINSSRILPKNFSSIVLSNIQIQSILSLFTLYVTKMAVNIFYVCFNLFYKILLKLIDIMESILLIFYKFLEKPAELMVEWIAEIFLIEWSSDLITYVPEAFDTTLWNSVTKFSRATLPFGGFVFGFLMQRIFLNSLEIFYNWMIKPDTDLMIRQKKGIIFWDIWTEILIQAAETYKMNLSSLSTIKEEQELLIENLLEDKGMQMQKSQMDSSKSVEKDSKFHNTNFLNSQMFKLSLTKMTPLMKFLQTSPKNPLFNSLEFSNLKNYKVLKNLFYPSQFFISENQFYDLSSFRIENEFSSDILETNTSLNSVKKWSVSQYLTTQGRDTDLFMDIHPPKSFLHISFLKTYLPAQEILGSLVCDIYSGLFAQKISKNILVVGAPGSAKSFFIQALAGETELKIVTDNAHRYALVQGGVPIGMKLLRDVFDSIALHTPCLFLLEDIHVIGERRPMLISDDENSKSTDSIFGAEQEEVHEKNRMIYQLSRHALSHYKRPYKGDFSLSIPTNHFCYDLFLGVSPPRKRRSELTTKSPLPVVRLAKALEGKDQMNTLNQNPNNFNENKNVELKKSLLSSLQISTEQIFAPPATSPFNILLMKEQKKLKPKKFVKELPWSGLSYDQFMFISKSQYSVRTKVALLAEIAMNNLSMKLDMITDLLVIIDSVRSNRGFVVFATTHMPSLLDPALRRPGRLDETISLPLLPNLRSRFEIFQTNLSAYSELLDFFDSSLLTSKPKQNENEIYASISQRLLLLFNTQKTPRFNNYNNLLMPKIFTNFFNDYPIYSMTQAFQTSMNVHSLVMNPTQLQNCLIRGLKKNTPHPKIQNLQSKQNTLYLLNKDFAKSKSIFSGNDKLNSLSFTYSQAGQFLVESLFIHDQTTYSSKSSTMMTQFQEIPNTEEQIFQTLYTSDMEFHQILFQLFAGKIAQFFVLNSSPKFIKSKFLAFSDTQKNSQVATGNSKSIRHSDSFSENLSVEEMESLNLKTDWWLTNDASLQTNPSQSSLFENIENFQNYWQSATSFLHSFFQKRYLYNKNSIVSKMLLFEDISGLREPPSPPHSSILMPAKKFENYKRTLRDFLEKPLPTIHEKIQIHQKQRFLKILYNVPIQTSFLTILNSQKSLNSLQNNPLDEPARRNQQTHFYNSFKELGYLDLLSLKPTSSYCFYKNRFLIRQRFSFLNQWWNGQLAEHNVETTYLSHVDWRSMFVQSLGDLVIDFPDADQYYNPRQRRWFLHSNSWNYWLSFEKNLTHEISQHYILHCFTKTSNLLNQNRELFDYLAFRFLRSHELKEIDLLHILIRFYKNEEF